MLFRLFEHVAAGHVAALINVVAGMKYLAAS
jgi:hypothetical protein